MDGDHTIRDDKSLENMDRRGDGQRYYSSSDSDKHHDLHHYHPYRRSDMGYLPNEFKKSKPPTFDGDLNKT